MIFVKTENMPPWIPNYILNIQTNTTKNSLNQAGREFTKQYFREQNL